jgi:DNA-binding HxlR family transcriptional regulator
MKKRYGAICPITHACKILEPRWSIHILTEMWAGSTRFNEIRRGVGNISPGLLSRRLKELERFGMIERKEDRATGNVDYLRTQKAIDLEPALNALGAWAQQNIAAEIALCDTDVAALMWKLRRDIDTEALPAQRVVLRFRFDDVGLGKNTFWLVFYPSGERDLCTTTPPGMEVDLYLETSLVSLGAILTARSTIDREREKGGLFTSGDARIDRSMDRWLPLSYYKDVGGILTLRANEAVRRKASA